MRRYTRFDCGLWDQPWFRELPDDSPLLWLWLNGNRTVLDCGLQRLDPQLAARETLLAAGDVARWLAAWQRLGLLESDGRWLLLPRFAREQCVTRGHWRRAIRQATALAQATQLAARWLDEHLAGQADAAGQDGAGVVGTAAGRASAG